VRAALALLLALAAVPATVVHGAYPRQTVALVTHSSPTRRAFIARRAFDAVPDLSPFRG